MLPALFCILYWRVERPPRVWVREHEVDANVCQVNQLHSYHNGFAEECVFVPVSCKVGVHEPCYDTQHVYKEAPKGVEGCPVVNNQGLAEIDIVQTRFLHLLFVWNRQVIFFEQLARGGNLSWLVWLFLNKPFVESSLNLLLVVYRWDYTHLQLMVRPILFNRDGLSPI